MLDLLLGIVVLLYVEGSGGSGRGYVLGWVFWIY